MIYPGKVLDYRILTQPATGRSIGTKKGNDMKKTRKTTDWKRLAEKVVLPKLIKMFKKGDIVTYSQVNEKLVPASWKKTYNYYPGRVSVNRFESDGIVKRVTNKRKLAAAKKLFPRESAFFEFVGSKS